MAGTAGAGRGERGPVPLASSWVFDSNQKAQISRSHGGDEINVLLTVRFKRTVAGQAKELSARRSQGCQKTIIIVSLETEVDFSLALVLKVRP